MDFFNLRKPSWRKAQKNLFVARWARSWLLWNIVNGLVRVGGSSANDSSFQRPADARILMAGCSWGFFRSVNTRFRVKLRLDSTTCNIRAIERVSVLLHQIGRRKFFKRFDVDQTLNSLRTIFQMPFKNQIPSIAVRKIAQFCSISFFYFAMRIRRYSMWWNKCFHVSASDHHAWAVNTETSAIERIFYRERKFLTCREHFILEKRLCGLHLLAVGASKLEAKIISVLMYLGGA